MTTDKKKSAGGSSIVESCPVSHDWGPFELKAIEISLKSFINIIKLRWLPS